MAKPVSDSKVIEVDSPIPTDSDDENVAVPWRNYAALIILFVINLLNFMDRYTVAGVLTELQDYFAINDSQAGLLQTVFIIFYIIFAPICGYLGDRYNRKWIMTVGIFIWSSAVLCSTFVPAKEFYVFLALRGIVGIGEASYITCSPTLIADMFTGKRRSRALMLFYFAIPVGSGLGFIVGSNVSELTGEWQWGMRVTPVLGAICLVLIIGFLREPARGEAEHANAHQTTYIQDIKHLLRNRTYIYNTISYTSIVFVTGALTWWAPTAVEHAWAMRNHKEVATKEAKANISLVFGALTCLGGFAGVTLGSTTAQFWRDGKSCFKRIKNAKADPYVCAIGSFFATPLLFAALQLFANEINIAWVFVFLAVTMLSLNWAIITDMLLYTVIPTRRATASAFQILFSHLFGDAISPYIIGVVSDGLRGSDPSATGHYYSLQHAFYIPNFVLIISGAFFLVSAFYIVSDRRKADIEAHGYVISATEQSGSTATSVHSDSSTPVVPTVVPI